MTDDKTKPDYYLMACPVGNDMFVYKLDHKRVAEALAILMKEKEERDQKNKLWHEYA